jgi:choline/ethanolamine kinase
MSSLLPLRVHSKGSVATLTEQVRLCRKEYECASSSILQCLSDTLVHHDPVILLDVATSSSSSSPPPLSTGDPTLINTIIQYQRDIKSTLESSQETAVVALPSSVVDSFQHQRARLLDLRQQHTAAKIALSTDLLPILNNVASYAPEFQNWAKPDLQPKDISVSAISGAMTNVIYKCELLLDPTNVSDSKTTDPNAHAVLVRLYGEGTDAFFDRQEELKVFSSLAKFRYGSHALLCQFENGRCERFFQGSRPVTIQEMSAQENWINKSMGHEVAVFHRLPVFETKPSYRQVVGDFLDSVRHCYGGLVKRSEIAWFQEKDINNNKVGQPLRSEEIKQWLHHCIHQILPAKMAQVEASLYQHESKYHANVVFGHNDLQPGNILIKDENLKSNSDTEENKRNVTFIDFEYARYVPRGYDIVNHWCEWAADYHGLTPHLMNYEKFPTAEQQKEFVTAYLQVANNKTAAADAANDGQSGTGGAVTEEEVESLIQEALDFEQLSHLWWGVWGLMQATQSSIDFDYIGYGKCRLDQLNKL